MLKRLRGGIVNQASGRAFENALEFCAKRNNILALRNHLAVTIIPGGRPIFRRSQLDWTLLSPLGAVAFVDQKSFAGTSFTFGQIDKHQLKLAVRIHQQGAVAGFLVLLRGLDRTAFFSAASLTQAGPRTRLTMADGRPLGPPGVMDLPALFA